MEKQIEIYNTREKRASSKSGLLKCVLAGTLMVPLIFGGCATIPLTQLERQEYKQSIEKYPDQVKFYNRMLNSNGRTTVSYREENNNPTTDLPKGAVKSRRDYGLWERIKRYFTNKPITRQELEVTEQVF
jgi:hypothetical protein